MNTKQKTTESSNEELSVIENQPAPRAPLTMPRNISPTERYEYIARGVEIKRLEAEFKTLTHRFNKVVGVTPKRYSPRSGASSEDLREIFPEIFAAEEEAPKEAEQMKLPITHELGKCSRLSLCKDCVTLRKCVKMMGHMKNQLEEIVEEYYCCLGKVTDVAFCVRVAQDSQTFSKQNQYMKAQFVRGLLRYSKLLGTKYRSGRLREHFILDHTMKQESIRRQEARDAKYESAFYAEGLGPIEHARGDCTEDASMCQDCVSLHKVHKIMKRTPERAKAALGLYWRVLESVPEKFAQHMVQDAKYWIPTLSDRAVELIIASVEMFCETLGPNYWQRSEILALVRESHTRRIGQHEKKFVAQAWASVDFNISSVDRLTDTLNRLFVDRGVGVDVNLWSRRMASFVLMLMQLCAESSVFIKITAVIQFLTHFDIPGLSTFRGYAEQLAQVFQAALASIRRATRSERLPDLYDEVVDEREYDDEVNEGLFRAQNDTPPDTEGLLTGTAKLLCAMAGITDYDVKSNARRVMRLDQLGRTIISTERLLAYATKLFKYAYEAALVHVFHVHPDLRELEMVSEKIPAWMHQVTDYYNNEGLVRVTKNVDEAKQVARWHRLGDGYNELLWKFKVMPKAYAIFKNVYNQCDKLYVAATPYLSETAMRVSPFTMLLTGGPGLGKSVVLHSIITDIMTVAFKRRGRIYKPGEQVHVHTSGLKHWDGYNEQAVVVVDDLFQNMSPEETVEQCMDICRMKNMVTWPVAKADLLSKGNTFFMSELVIMTGNVAIPHDITKVIRSFDAIRRRIDMLITHKVVPAYLDKCGRLDKVKVAQEFPMTFIEGKSIAADITPIFRYDVVDNQGSCILRDGTYAELIELAIRMKEWEHEHEEGVMRLNYLRAGLNIDGTEKKFEAQMWRSSPPKVPENKYEGDLLFETDVEMVNRLLYEGQSRVLRPSCPYPQEGFLTEEERIEIFATLKQEAPPDDSWTERMKAVYNRVKVKTTEVKSRFMDALGGFVDRQREVIQSSMMFKVGAVVLLSISVISLGVLSHRLLRAKDPVQAEVSGDEKTRQVRTKFIEHHAQGEVARKDIHGRPFVAVRKDSERTVWVPEKSLVAENAGRRPLTVDQLLWVDDGESLPHDLISHREGEVIAQACPDRNAYNVGVNRVTNNAVVLRAYEKGEVVSLLRGLFVYGRVLMAPRHFLHGLNLKDTIIEAVSCTGIVYRFNLNECDMKVPTEEMDIVFLRLPKRFQCFTDIRSHFYSVESINKYSLTEAMLWVIDGDTNGKMIALCDNVKKDAVLDYQVVSSHNGQDTENIHIVRSFVYRGVTLSGYCGAPLIWLNPSVQGGHILGIHVAGSNLRGVTTPISREFLYTFLRDWNDISINVPMLDPRDGAMTAQSKRAVSKQLGLSHYGRVMPSKQVRLPSDTNIKCSPLFGVFPDVTGPALLAPTRELNPLRSGILKQKVPLVTFEEDIVAHAVAHFRNDLLSMPSPYKEQARVLTVKEALNGIPGDEWMPPMNMHTSPGYPYVTARTHRPGKFDFVEGEPGERELIACVSERLNDRIVKAQRREIDMTLFVDILKDERVKKEKIALGKTRIFNVAPFDLNIAVRMYCQHFAAHIMYNHIYGECSVGLNPHSDEWATMYHHMKRKGGKWIGGDYSNYDKQLSYQLLMAVVDIINEFYGDNNADVRECLFETMFAAFHLAERDVYRVGQGNPSGIVMTSLINSLVNSIMMRIVYIKLGGHMSTFSENVCLKTYGDDNIACVANTIPWFNMPNISKCFASYGIVYNQPNKTAMNDDVLYLPIEELTYLKRGFREECGRVFAPLNMDSITEMVNWIRQSNDDDEATRANYLAACREMYHYGREKFDEFTQYVCAFAQKRSFLLPYTDFQCSGEYWGAERSGHVNFATPQTAHGVDNCCDSDNEETLFRAQLSRAPRKIKAVRSSMPELLISALIIYSTTTQTPQDNTAASTVNEDNVTSRVEITTFSDSSVVTIQNPQNVPPVPSTPVDPYMKQTLTEFLSRVYYYSGTWPSSLAPGALLFQVTFPNFLFSVPQIWDKLKNFTYFRAGVKIGLRINGSKFHYGQLLVSYTPQFNNTLELRESTNNIYTASGCPSFTISPSENEVHEFVMPYALPYQYVPMYYTTSTAAGDSAFQFGVLNIYVLNPLSNASGTPTPVGFTLFCNFVDVDVAGYNPVAYTIPARVTQDQTTLPATLVSTPARPTTVPQVDPLPPFSGIADEDPFVAQKASKEQTEKSEKGIVGSILESVSTISGALSFIPEIGVVASGISIATGGAAMIANHFGWTNPTSLRAMQPVVKQWTNMVNTHGLSDCQNLGLAADSIISSQAALLGGAANEMTMLHIAQTPMLLAAGITWNGADVYDISLWESPVTPLAEFTSASITRTFPTFLSWMSRSCAAWRGSIRYHIQVTCSQMHVGRLRVSYIPLNNLNALPSNAYASGASFIMDIQQQTTMSFTMPYISHLPWQATAYRDSGGTVQIPNTGYIRISVLNELNHPTVPVPGVFINVWTSAGPDFQLGRPTGNYLRMNWTTSSNDPEPPEEFVAQGLTREMIRAMPAPPLIPATGSREEHICMPDEVHHIKDLIMRPSWIGSTIAIAPADIQGLARIDPFAPMVRDTGILFGIPDFLSYFRVIFRYSRGSHRVLNLPMNNSLGLGASTTISNDLVYHNGAPLFTNLPRFVNNTTPSNLVITQVNAKNGLMFATSDLQSTATIPYYATQYAIPNAGWNGGVVPSTARWNIYGYTPTANVTYQGKPEVCLAAGDDYELMFLVGPPALTNAGI